MKAIDETGNRYGRLVARQYLGSSKWLCDCDCGNTVTVDGRSLRTGKTKSCGCLHNESIKQPREDLTDKRFGRLIAKQYKGDSKWMCECDCGNTTLVRTRLLKSGNTQSCGCLKKDIDRKRMVILKPGQRFGRLVTDEYVNGGKWKCRCDCGNTIVTATTNLTSGSTKSCGCLHRDRIKDPHQNLIGQRFGRLTVKSYDGGSKWLCECDCGNTVSVMSNALKTGNTQSCGCLHSEIARKNMTTHGARYDRLYGIWNKMKQRCYNKNDPSYKYYGGRGISLCNEWLESFVAFRDWAIGNGYQDGLTIDRIDVNGNYEPDNCRWATMTQQARNKRNNRAVCQLDESGNIIARFNTIAEASEATGVLQSGIQQVCSGKVHSAKQTLWCYAEDVIGELS